MKSQFEQEDIVYVTSVSGEHDDGFEDIPEDIMFAWGIKEFGFGTTTFYYEDGVLKCDNEAMNKESIKKILCEFVDRAEFQS